MSKHTPGPWGCVDTSNHAHDYRLTQPNGQPLPLNVVANDHTEQRANAKLIAAAPLMLNALRLIMAGVAGCDKRIEYVLAREAITKATGEQL